MRTRSPFDILLSELCSATRQCARCVAGDISRRRGARQTSLKPELLAVGRESIVLFDFGSYEISSYTLSGKQVWTSGRKGSGPGEFTAPTSMVVDSRGTIYLLDPGNSRVSVFSNGGGYQRSIPLEQRLHRLAVLTDGSLIGSPISDKLLLSFDTDGKQTAAMALPEELSRLSPLVRENHLLSNNRDELLVLHRWSTKTLTVRGADFSLIRTGELLNPQAFPGLKSYSANKGTVVSRVDPAASRVVRYATIRADTLFVIDNRDDEGRQFIDAYRLESLKYISSRLTPARLRAFAFSGDQLIGLVDDPLPALVGWRWVPRRP